MSHPTSDTPAFESSAEHDDLLARLPQHDVAPERSQSIRRRAHLLLHQRRLHGSQPSSPGWLRSYHRFVEPAVLIGLGLWQLAWTVQDTVALFLP